jgi:chemotaxis protein MotB
MAGKGGGAWKVAYADFVTAMMAFFMVLWITGQSQDIKEAIADHFTHPFGKFDSGGALRPPKSNEEFDPTGRHSKADGTDNPQMDRKLPFRLKLSLGSRTLVGTAVIFAEGSTELDEVAREELASLLPMLAGKPQRIEVRGHASRRLMPHSDPDADPWQVSYARCISTMKFLEENGIKPERIRLSQAGIYERQQPEFDERVDVFLLSEIADAELAEPVDSQVAVSREQAGH